MKPRKISHIVLMGDSLSDRGVMDHRLLFGIIPMDKFSGLRGESPDGRFTNGYAWSDFVSAMIANEFLIKDIEDQKNIKAQRPSDIADSIIDKSYSKTQDGIGWRDRTDIADGVIDGDLKIVPLIHKSYSLDKYKEVDYQGANVIRSGFAEGGLTSHDYSWTLSKSITLFFTRLVLSTLGGMRKLLLADDSAHELSQKHKAETLVVEWSGANDLITVNSKASFDEVDKAIKARIDNVKQLVKNGYRNFVLFNLPDLALVPRFQAKTEADRDLVSSCSKRFNVELAKACEELALSYPHCSIDVFDVSQIFTDTYNHPEPYFEKDKLKTPYRTSPDFKMNPNGTSPAKGYMFWDDVHPTADMHAQLAKHFLTMFKEKYNISEPKVEPIEKQRLNISEDQLLVSFRKVYGEKLRQEQSGFFGRFRNSNINYQVASLDELLTNALYNGGGRSLAVMKELQWFDERGNLHLNIKAIEDAVTRVDAAHSYSAISSPNR